MVGIRLHSWRINFIAHIYSHCAFICGCTIRHGIGEVGRTVIAIVWIERNGAIWIQRDRTIVNRNCFTWLDRLIINFCNGQLVPIRIRIIIQYIDGDRVIFRHSDFVVNYIRCIIDWRHIDMHRSFYWRMTIRRRIFEIRWAIVVRIWRKGNGSVWVESRCTIINGYSFAWFNWLTINFGHSQFIPINIRVIIQDRNGNW